MSASFCVYIDESGDEGWKFLQGSSEWFVLSGVITHYSTDLAAVKVVDTVSDKIHRLHGTPLHFRKLSHAHRLVYVDEISRQPVTAVNVFVHKPSLGSADHLKQSYRLYFYMVRLLLERVSWYCRDNRPNPGFGDGTADLVFSNRYRMSYENLKGYLRLLESREDVRIDWTVIRPNQVSPKELGQCRGLQVVDAVASGFCRAVQPNEHGFAEGRYASILSPVLYRYRGRSWGYGVKWWPTEAKAIAERDGPLSWAENRAAVKTAGPGS